MFAIRHATADEANAMERAQAAALRGRRAEQHHDVHSDLDPGVQHGSHLLGVRMAGARTWNDQPLVI